MRAWIVLGILLALPFNSPIVARADDSGVVGDAGEAAADSEAEAGGAPDAEASDAHAVVVLERTSGDVRALTDEQLDASVSPQDLFEVPLGDEDAIRVEAERLRVLLREVDRAKGPASMTGRAKGDHDLADAGVEPTLWRARIELDRARLAFYDLPEARRRVLLWAHTLLQRDAEPPPTPAQLREREAEAQREAALSAVQRARTEAERLVSTELARLLGVEHAQSALEEELVRRRSEIGQQRDVKLGWQQRAIEARGHPGPSADRTYEDLRRALRAARDALSQALDELSMAPSEVPGAGPDPFVELRVDVNTSAARTERARVEAASRWLDEEVQELRRERAAQLFDEIDTLNGERLALLGALSPEKRRAVTGFTMSGWDQARSEARQLTLIVRYHRLVIGYWLVSLRHPSKALGGALAGDAGQALEWVCALGVFGWWRRRSTALLRLLHRRAQESDRREQLPSPSPASRSLAFAAQVHRPIEWLALLVVLRWLLPATTQEVLEIRLVSVLATWILSAALAVDSINALAGTRRKEGPQGDETESAALRLRSLRFVGRVVVAFGVVLVISSMLVGRGTIYQWVFSTCWLASIPVILVLVRWWRTTVFRRTERIRRPAAIQRWVLANRAGWWTSFAAAAIGGLYLFANGGLRGARNWIGRFVITRRALAYLFRRQLGRREPAGVVGPIPEAVFEVLGPGTPSTDWISTDADEALSRLTQRIRGRRGGMIAIVGERGMGKTAALRRLLDAGDDALLLDALPGDADPLRARLAEGLGLPPTATLEAASEALAVSAKLRAVLVDNAQRFVQPVMGGLAVFDAVLGTASRHASAATWVFALDQVIWQFLERARGARPLFDEVIRLDSWREEQIVGLLQARTKHAGLTPSFEPLLDPLPESADEIDKQEALAQRAAEYYRLLWDAASGNPGIALHMWRRSLGTDPASKTVVRPTSTLDTSDLERLPDSTVFVLRAVLQLAPARAENIVKGTLIRLPEVTDALRYAASRGYIEEDERGYRVTWTWLRAITLFLQRRHLLVTR